MISIHSQKSYFICNVYLSSVTIFEFYVIFFFCHMRMNQKWLLFCKQPCCWPFQLHDIIIKYIEQPLTKTLWYDDDRNIRLRQIWLYFLCFADISIETWTTHIINVIIVSIWFIEIMELFCSTIQLNLWFCSHLVCILCGILCHFAAFHHKSREKLNQNKRIALSIM